MSETSTTTEIGGWCLHCGDIGRESLTDHFEQRHLVRAEKPRVDILSWSDRVTKVIEALEEIKADDDPKRQIALLDERVTKPLYLVRNRLAEMQQHRLTEGSRHGSS